MPGPILVPPNGPEASRRVTLDVDPAGVDLRLDQFLAQAIEGLSRGRARVLVELGGVFVDGTRSRQLGRRLHLGQRVDAWLGGALDRAGSRLGRAAREQDESGLPRPTLVFEDEHLLVVDKPAGLITAPTPESDRGNLVSLLEGDGHGRLYVVHRLDLPTSGLLVLARTDLANRVLSEAFRERQIERVYRAVVRGHPAKDAFVVDAPVGGRPARTQVEVVDRLECGLAAIRARLETGRTHQIRIHLAGAGHPLLGDPRYGREEHQTGEADRDRGGLKSGRSHSAEREKGGRSSAGSSGRRSTPEAGAPLLNRRLPRPPRLALHAETLGFDHPASGEPLAFESVWPPPDLAAWFLKLR